MYVTMEDAEGGSSEEQGGKVSKRKRGSKVGARWRKGGSPEGKGESTVGGKAEAEAGGTGQKEKGEE
jgi:hypothetical protein